MISPTIDPEILFKNQNWLLHFIRTIIKDDFLAEDIVQETFIVALENEHGKGLHRGWLRGVAHNLAQQSMRSDLRRANRESKKAEQTEQISEEEIEAVIKNPRQVSALSTQVMTFIEGLPEAQQRVLQLRYRLNLELGEIGERLGIPEKEVYRLRERGCRSVQNRLKMKHGEDWRAHCAAIMGIKLVGPFAVLTKTLAVAAALLCGGVGLWLGFNQLTNDAPNLRLENEALAALPTHMELDTADTATFAPETADSHLTRVNDEQASLLFHGAYVQVLDKVGNPLPYVEVIAEWSFGPVYTLFFTTNEDGYAALQLPNTVTDFTLRTKVEGCLNPTLSSLASYPAQEVELQLSAGSTAQTLCAVDSAGNPVAGIILEVKSLGQPTGYFLSGPNGFAEALLPGPATYLISIENSFAYFQQKFQIDAESALQPLLVKCAPLPTDVTVRAVDATNGQPIPSATYTGRYYPRLEFYQFGDLTEIPMESTNGTLWYPGVQFEPRVSQIVIHAPGYEPVTAEINADTSPALEIEMFPLVYHPARIELPDPQRRVASASLRKQVRNLRWPPRLTGADQLDYGWATLELSVAPNGTFQLPLWQDSPFPFDLRVVDDLGTPWNILGVTRSELEEQHNGTIVFSLQEKPHIPLTLQLLHSDGTPVVDAELLIQCLERRDNSNPRLVTNSVGEIHLLAVAGEELYLLWPSSPCIFQGKFRLPTQGEHFAALLQLPDFDSSLAGQVLLADDSAAEFQIALSKANFSVPLQVDGGPSFPIQFNVRHRPQPGYFLTENIPSGSYDTKVTLVAGIHQAQTQATDSEPVFRFPALQEFRFLVTNAEGAAVPLAWIRPLTSSEPRCNLARGVQTDGQGTSQFTLENSAEGCTMVIAAAGFEPLVIHDPSPTQLNHYALVRSRMVPNLETLPLGITLQEDTFWMVDLWGGCEDPRQGLVWEYLPGNELRMVGAPQEGFRFLEVDANCVATGREISVPAE
jgi:RNA polymerase sigma factor (sigma-70 family)